MHPNGIVFSLYVSTFYLVEGLCNASIMKATRPNHLRDLLKEQMERNYKYIPYPGVKEILHTDMRNIDIYGDKEETMNVEHIFPQCMFSNDPRKKVMKTDLHNLYLCNTRLNTLRSNFKYIGHDNYVPQRINDISNVILDAKGNIVSDPTNIFINQSCLMMINRNRQTFIPSNYSRGKIARSLAYFAIKYDYIDELKEVIDIRNLIKWNIEDPVSNDEYLKNIITYKHQHNLNPFILEPDLASYCFTDHIDLTADEFNSITSKKKGSTIDPLHSIRFFMRDNENKHLKRMINKKPIAKKVENIQNSVNYNLRYNIPRHMLLSETKQLVDSALEQRREIIGYYLASQN